MAWRSERASLTDPRRFRITAVATEHQPIVPAAHPPVVTSQWLPSERLVPYPRGAILRVHHLRRTSRRSGEAPDGNLRGHKDCP